MIPNDVIAIGPFIAAVGVAIAVLIVDLVAPGRRGPALVVSLGGLAIVAALTIAAGAFITDDPTARIVVFGGAYVVDGLTTFLDLLFIAIVAFTIVFGPDYLEARGLPLAEFSVVLLFAMTGAMLIAASADLLILFIALELMVLPGYMLAGYHKTDGYSTEGAIKYFLLGSFSSAIFLFGLAFAWGTTGTTSIAGVREALEAVAAGTGSLQPALILGLGFMTTGVAFKIAAVPFHYWTPDAYQGSPTPVTGYLSVGPKVGAFALILRLFVEALGPLRTDWLPVVIVLAVLTMTLGNLVALTQNNVKRMLAYSSIAHAGYVLIGIVAGTSRGITATLVYLLIYSFMQLGAFAVVVVLRRTDVAGEELKDFSGLAFRNPFAAFAMLLFMLSLGGIPPTAGFMGKFWLFSAAIDAHYYWLAVIGVLNSAISLYYYVRIVVFMYLKKEAVGSEPATTPALAVVLGLAVAGTLVFGVYPRLLFEVADASARTLGAAGVAAALR
jgi:NADH-quinone oxidoreductase subunit N